MAISVTTEAVQAAAGHVDTVNAQLTTTMNNLKARCEGAQGNFFEGGAARQFQQLMVRYAEAQKKVSESLNEIAAGIRANGKGYDNAEQNVLTDMHRAGASGGLDIPTIVKA